MYQVIVTNILHLLEYKTEIHINKDDIQFCSKSTKTSMESQFLRVTCYEQLDNFYIHIESGTAQATYYSASIGCVDRSTNNMTLPNNSNDKNSLFKCLG